MQCFGRSVGIYIVFLNVDALRAVQKSGPNNTKHVLVTRGPIFISGKYGSRERYIEQINTEQTRKSGRVKFLY